ncbi:hypothetical protein LK994_04740 [Ferruginibacter lapsinanis]|uniref:hypothetical protein n=1 Tax=Ferruginibacter lapsinanis TaxID=563172 RepID=UPI001E32CB21|nr:hypothetical protein [Ferruginibacter lapsinanis]UEG50780.1 hypothetical protein LK994_04740 [Ferruginibacter lapsinanis]
MSIKNLVAKSEVAVACNEKYFWSNEMDGDRSDVVIDSNENDDVSSEVDDDQSEKEGDQSENYFD